MQDDQAQAEDATAAREHIHVHQVHVTTVGAPAAPWADKEGRGKREPVKACRVTALVRGLPGFASLWEAKVPAEYVERDRRTVHVNSPCGERVEVPEEQVVYCPDDCGRWYLRIEREVRVKRWPREQAAAA
jgi:hypothetical protein